MGDQQPIGALNGSYGKIIDHELDKSLKQLETNGALLKDKIRSVLSTAGVIPLNQPIPSPKMSGGGMSRQKENGGLGRLATGGISIAAIEDNGMAYVPAKESKSLFGGDNTRAMNSIMENHKTKYQKPYCMEIFLISSPTGFTAMEKKILGGGREAYFPIESMQKLWDNTLEEVSSLPEPIYQALNEKPCCFFMGDSYSQYNTKTDFLIEFTDTGIRYIYQNYKGISTWYKSTWPPEEIFSREHIHHPFYNKILIPQPGSFLRILEALVKDAWEKQHRDCHYGHFYVNIYLHGDIQDLNYTGSKFTTHRVCGDAIVANLFHLIQGGWSEPKYLWGFGEIEFDYGIHDEVIVRLGNYHPYEDLEKSQVMIKDMQWLNETNIGREFIWLVPMRMETNGLCEADPYRTIN